MATSKIANLPAGGVPTGFNENATLIVMKDMAIWIDIFGTVATLNRYYNAWKVY